jgi:predicted amidohydrolase
MIATLFLLAGSMVTVMVNSPTNPKDWTKDWAMWAPRAEIAPKFAAETTGGRNGEGSLKIEGGGNSAAWGLWRKKVGGIVGGRHYRFTAHFRAEDVSNPQWSVSSRVTWLNQKGDIERPADIILNGEKHGEWTKCEQTMEAPAGARAALIELALGWCPNGTVWWDEPKLVEVPATRNRIIRAMTLFDRPRETGSATKSVEEFCRLLEGAGSQKPDIVCLPEGITAIGTGKSYVDVSEPVPGPTTARLGVTAKRLNSYIVAGLYERVGHVVYNTAVLIGRKGELVGKYRKTHLPREEVEAGLTPGDSYPIFDTDFGKVALMICWDVQFPEPARAMAAKGAEIIMLPIAGGSETLAKARAIENHVFLVSSSYDMKTFIVDPKGDVMVEATNNGETALAELHLDRKIIQYWTGDMKPRTWKERRTDIKGD